MNARNLENVGQVIVVPQRPTKPNWFFTRDESFKGDGIVHVGNLRQPKMLELLTTEVEYGLTAESVWRNGEHWMSTANIRPTLYEHDDYHRELAHTSVTRMCSLMAHVIWSIARQRDLKSIVWGADNSYDGCLPVFIAANTRSVVYHVGELDRMAIDVARILGVYVGHGKPLLES